MSRRTFLQRGAEERHVHLPRLRPEDRPCRSPAIDIDRDKTAQLGLKMSDVGGALGVHAGRRLRQLFQHERPFLQGHSAGAAALPAQSAINCSTITSAPPTARSVPLSTIATIATKTVPESLNHFQQLNSATIQGVAMPGVAQGDALAYLQELAARTLPHGYSVDYGGLSRQYVQESSGVRRHLRLRPHHHLPGAGGAVRKLPRSGHHPGVGADVDRRRADLHQPRRRRRVAQHLYRGRAGDADGPDQQARHSDRASSPTSCRRKGTVEARGDRTGRRASACGRS